MMEFSWTIINNSHTRRYLPETRSVFFFAEALKNHYAYLSAPLSTSVYELFITAIIDEHILNIEPVALISPDSVVEL